MICLAWNRQTQKAEHRVSALCQDISLCVLSWESKINFWGGLYQRGVNSSRHEAHNGLGLKVNWNLIMSSPHLAQLPEFVRHFTPCNACDQRMNSKLWNNWNFEAAPLSLFLILCLPFFPPDCLPPFPANSPPTLSSSSAEKTHFLMSLLNQNAVRQTDVVWGPTHRFYDTEVYKLAERKPEQ